MNSRKLISLLLLVPTSALIGSNTYAQFTHEGEYELSLLVPYYDDIDVGFDGGASATVDSDLGFGFGFLYHFTDRFAGIATASWISRDYSAERVLDDPSGTREFLSSSLDSFTASVGGEYYLTTGQLKPFLNGNVGWNRIDTNIPSGQPSIDCWWDPWFGYLCSGNVPTYDESSFYYGVGAGLRFDLSGNMFLKGGLYRNWLDYDNASGSSDVDFLRFELGFSF